MDITDCDKMYLGTSDVSSVLAASVVNLWRATLADVQLSPAELHWMQQSSTLGHCRCAASFNFLQRQKQRIQIRAMTSVSSLGPQISRTPNLPQSVSSHIQLAVLFPLLGGVATEEIGEQEIAARSIAMPSRKRLRKIVFPEEGGAGHDISCVEAGRHVTALQRRADVQTQDFAVWVRMARSHCQPYRAGRDGFLQNNNSCYIASAVQALAHTDSFAHWCGSRTCTCGANDCPSCHLARTYMTSRGNGMPTSLDNWDSLVQSCGLEWGKQHDIVDFFTSLLNKWSLTTGVAAFADYKLFEQHCFAWVDNTIGNVPNCSCNLTTGSHRRKSEKYGFLTLPLPTCGKTSVQELLHELWQEQEAFEGLKEHACTACGRKHKITIQRNLLDAHQHECLPIALGRAQPDGGKNRIPVTINTRVQVQGRCFILKSMTQHLGPTALGGHYLAWVKQPLGYIIFDDAQKHSMQYLDMPEFVWETAVTLFYERVRDFGEVLQKESISRVLASFLLAKEAWSLSVVGRTCDGFLNRRYMAEVKCPVIGEIVVDTVMDKVVDLGVNTCMAATNADLTPLPWQGTSDLHEPAQIRLPTDILTAGGTSHIHIDNAAILTSTGHEEMSSRVEHGTGNRTSHERKHGENNDVTQKATPIIPPKSAHSEPRQATMEDTLGASRFAEDVETLLQIYVTGGKDLTGVWAFLASLPPSVHDVQHPSSTAANAHIVLERYLEDLLKDNINANAAFDMQDFLGDTLHYPLAVLLQATCVAHGWPLVFVIDCVFSILSSLVNKHLYLQLGQYKCRHRYWSNGVAPAGAGKSPCMKPFTKLVSEVMRNNGTLTVGARSDNFHFVQSSTTAAGIDQLRKCQAYLMMWSTDAGRCLSLKFANGGETDPGKHMDLAFFLDAAHGDEFSHQTMETRRKIGKVIAINPAAPVPETEAIMLDPTNVNVMWLIQLTVFAMYWCQVARNWPIGLVQRILFSFAGAVCTRRQARFKRFFDDVTSPIIRKLFSAILGHLGPKTNGFPGIFFDLTAEQQRSVEEIEQTLQEYTHSSRRTTALLCSSLPKCMYWLGCSITLNHVVATVLPCILAAGPNAKDSPFIQPPPTFDGSKISDATFLTGVLFVVKRYMFGQCVLNKCVTENLAGNMEQTDIPRCDANNAMLESVLRRCSHAVIDESVILRSVHSLQRQLDLGTMKQIEEAKSLLQRILQEITLLGLGEASCTPAGSIVSVRKYNRDSLSASAVEWLRRHRIPTCFFGLKDRERTFLPQSLFEQPKTSDARTDPVASTKCQLQLIPSKKKATSAQEPDSGNAGSSERRGAIPKQSIGSIAAEHVSEMTEPRAIPTPQQPLRGDAEIPVRPRRLPNRSFASLTTRNFVFDLTESAGVAGDPALSMERKESHDQDTHSDEPEVKRPRNSRQVWNRGQPVHDVKLTPINNAREGVKTLTDYFVTQGCRTQWLWKATEKSYYRYHGKCAESQNCSVTYQARVPFRQEEQDQVRQFGQHSPHTGEIMRHGRLLSAEQQEVAEAYQQARAEGQMKLRGLLEHWKAKGLHKLPHQKDKDLRNWIVRENQKALQQKGLPKLDATKPIPVVIFDASLELWRVAGIEGVWNQSDMARLCVLPGMSLTSGAKKSGRVVRGYVPFTCKGMLSQLQRWEPAQPLVLAADAKVGQGTNAWRTATIGFLKKDGLRKTTFSRISGKRYQMMAYTTTFCPILQARMHQETNENWRDMFRDFVNIVCYVRGQDRVRD